MMQRGIPLGQWRVLAPVGLTQTGRIRRFQNRTVKRLGEVAEVQAAKTYEQLVSRVEQVYREGTGELASTLQYQVTRNREEIQVNFMAGTKHVVFLTSLTGAGGFNPQGHIIRARRGSHLRFFWKHPTGGGVPGVYSFRQVHWRTRAGSDVMAEVLSAGAQEFQRAMIAAHDDALVEFIQNEAQIDTRSARVSTIGGSYTALP